MKVGIFLDFWFWTLLGVKGVSAWSDQNHLSDSRDYLTQVSHARYPKWQVNQVTKVTQVIWLAEQSDSSDTAKPMDPSDLKL